MTIKFLFSIIPLGSKFSINIEISEEEANIFCDNDLDKKIVNLTYFEIERENNKTIFEVSTFASSREQAKYISDNWKENAINIYPKVIDLLTNPNQEL